MSPESLIIDRKFNGVGRIKRASGTHIPAVRRRVSAMLTALFDEGRLDILRAIRDGKLGMMQVYEAHQSKALASLPVGATMQLARVTMEAWVDGLGDEEISNEHRKSMRSTVHRIPEDATIADLPALLETLRDSLGKKHARSFNLRRAHVMAFVRRTLKRTHPVYVALQAVETRTKKGETRIHPMTPAELHAWFPDPDSDHVDAIAWSMATTGMGPREYWGRWNVVVDRIHVEGTKRAGRVRDVPLVQRPVVPRLSRGRWEIKFRARTNRAVQPYDLRRTYAGWLEESEIPRSRRIRYMGHSAPSMTDLYERRENDAHLKSDAEKITRFIESHTKAHTVKRLTSSGT